MCPPNLASGQSNYSLQVTAFVTAILIGYSFKTIFIALFMPILGGCQINFYERLNLASIANQITTSKITASVTAVLIGYSSNSLS